MDSLRSKLIHLAHKQPALRAKLLPVLKNAGHPVYEDLDLDDLGVGDKLKNFIDQLKHDAREMLEQAQAVEKAWGDWDVDALVSLGALTEQDKDHLWAAWNAQQDGNEEEMQRQLSRVATKNAGNQGEMRRDTLARAQTSVTEAQGAVEELINQVDTGIGLQYASDRLNDIRDRLEDIGLELVPLRRFTSAEKNAGGRVQSVKRSLWSAIQNFRSTAEGLIAQIQELQVALKAEGTPPSRLVLDAVSVVKEAEEQIGGLISITR